MSKYTGKGIITINKAIIHIVKAINVFKAQSYKMYLEHKEV
jgi:hypothetical protein